jgi:hypothetical protein
MQIVIVSVIVIACTAYAVILLIQASTVRNNPCDGCQGCPVKPKTATRRRTICPHVVETPTKNSVDKKRKPKNLAK